MTDIDRPILRKRLRREALAHTLEGGGPMSTVQLLLLNEAVATTMLEHPEWPDE